LAQSYLTFSIFLIGMMRFAMAVATSCSMRDCTRRAALCAHALQQPPHEMFGAPTPGLIRAPLHPEGRRNGTSWTNLIGSVFQNMEALSAESCWLTATSQVRITRPDGCGKTELCA